MSPEELLKILKDGGMDDETIKKLLSDTLASLEGPSEDERKAMEEQEAAEAAEASKYLGVEL